MRLSSRLPALAAAVVLALDHDPTPSFVPLDCAPDSDGARACPWSPDGTTMLVARGFVGARPMDIEVSASLNLAIMPLAEDDALALVDVTARALGATVPLSGAEPYQIELSADGLLAFVACAASDTVVVVDLATASEAWSLPTGFLDSNPGPTSNLTDALSITFR